MRTRLWSFLARHPTLASLLLIAALVGVTASDVPRLRRARAGLGARTFDADVVIGLGAATVICAGMVLALRIRHGRLRNISAGLAFAAWFVAFVWSHPRHFYTRLTSSADVVMAVASSAAVLVGGVVVVRAPRARRTAQPTAATGTHDAEVWYVVDNQQPPTFEPYYVAHCSCDWVGPAHPDPQGEGPARRDALAHTPHVSPQVTRPLA